MREKILQFLSKLTCRLYKEKKPRLSEIKKVLVLRLDHIGDVLLVTPLLRVLRNNLPNAHISIAVGSWAAGILDGNPCIDETIVFDYPLYNRCRKGTKWGNLIESFRFIRKIRQGKYDLVIDARSNLSTLIFAYLSGAHYKAGFDIGGRGFALDIRAKDDSSLHQIDRNLLLAKALGMEIQNKNMEIHFSEEDKHIAKTFLDENKISQSDLLIAVHPGAPWPPRRWDVQNFAEVIKWLIEQFKSKILIIGSQTDKDVRDDLKKLLDGFYGKDIIDCIGKTNLKQTAIVLQRCRFYLGVDSAPMHMAAAMGTPVIALMGPGEYPRFAPYGDNHIVIRKDVGCNPCRQNFANQTCGRGVNVCMKAITVSEVLEAIKVKLKE